MSKDDQAIRAIISVSYGVAQSPPLAWPDDAESAAHRERFLAVLQKHREEALEQRRREEKAERYRAGAKYVARAMDNKRLRNRLMTIARQQGATYAELAEIYGLCPQACREIIVRLERRAARNVKRLWLRAHASRPIDMGGPRDVLLSYEIGRRT